MTWIIFAIAGLALGGMASVGSLPGIPLWHRISVVVSLLAVVVGLIHFQVAPGGLGLFLGGMVCAGSLIGHWIGGLSRRPGAEQEPGGEVHPLADR